MKVVLSTPPGQTTERWPPLGLLYLASSCMQKRSDEVGVFDAFCENLSEEELVERVVREKPDVFGMNSSTHKFLDTISTMRSVHEASPETKLVLGGIHATFTADKILRDYPFVDYIIKGEGEVSFPKLLDCIEKGEAPSGVPGIGFAENGAVNIEPDILIEDLDSLPFPARELLPDLDYGYIHENIRLTFGKFTTISSSRGCPFRCSYCSCAAFTRRTWRPRSPENVVDELEDLYRQGYECCVFVDDNLTLNRRRIERMCDLISKRRIKMQFYCEGRVDSSPFSLLTKMREAGFEVIYFGIESAQKHVLNYYRKMIDIEQARKAVEDAKHAGMIVVTSYIMGAPVESLGDVNRTIDFIREARAHGVQINILDCLVGTDIWDDLEREGVIRPDDWKTNHRIYEYNKSNITRADLESAVNRGYAAYLDAWKSKEGAKELLRTIMKNRTARTVVIKNLMNPNTRRKLKDSRRFK
ncbi:MAG: radical SAM protein [Methanobacteriota archaeon]|nr:MAG: radical SAM protein [Euryarchaeota archaeon]